MKKQLLVFLLFTIVSGHIFAQRQISGKVTSGEDGSALPGVNVVVVGSQLGTITDVNGNYTLDVPNGAKLKFSYIGYLDYEVEVGNQSIIDVVMEPDVKQLSEVVVTAFGIEKEKKALGYSVTELSGDEFTEAREINLGDALQGKIAGVNVANIGSGVAGSSRVVIRGNTSIAGNNQPLYVVDGVPIDNTQLGSAGMWGGADQGDGLVSINPDDIESISVLKGNTAAALYGSRASNGVILITTKKGTKRKGIGVELNSNYTVDKFFDFFDWQTEYGHGTRGEKPTTQKEALDYGASAWGDRLDGSPVIQFDGEMRPYSFNGDNYQKFYRTGQTWTNTLALVGGGDKQTFRFSASDLRNKAITPNSGMNRQNITLTTNANWVEKLTLSAKIQYVREDVQNRSRLSDAPGNGNYTLGYLAPSINVEDLKGPTDKLGAKEDGTELQYSSNIYSQNPYWAAYQFETNNIRNRIIGSALLRWDITEWLWVHGRIGTDWYQNRRRDLEPYGTGYRPFGQLWERERTVQETNMEYLIGFDNTYGGLRINAFFGGNKLIREDESINIGGTNFNIPFFHQVSNLSDQRYGYGLSKKGINSLYGSVELSWKNYLFLTATGRNDWFSTLNPETNSIFYPSIGGSFVFSDAFTLPEFITFGKLRVSWAQVGGDTNPYQTALTYSLWGQGHMGAALGRITQGSVPNKDLKPLTVSEYEIGFDLRFFNNRLGIDYAYYNRLTTDDILNATISQSTGYGSATVNVGEVSNKGHEILLTATPIDGNFSWDFSINFSYNDNQVLKLVGDQKVFQAQSARSRRAFAQHRIAYTDENGVSWPGGYSLIVGTAQLRLDGKKVYDTNGLPVLDPQLRILGSGIHPYVGGFNNTFRFKNFNLSFLIDFKAGGDLYSGTNVGAVGSGMHKMTLDSRENGIQIDGVLADGTPIQMVIPGRSADPSQIIAQDYWARYNDISEYFIYDASFVKLRQFVFGYTFPKSMMDKTFFNGLSLSFVARNLWLIYSGVENVDPESTYNTSNGQGLEWYGVPQSRSFGFNLRAQF